MENNTIMINLKKNEIFIIGICIGITFTAWVFILILIK